MAERQGFEPWRPVKAYWFSKPARSAALPPLRVFFRCLAAFRRSPNCTSRGRPGRVDPGFLAIDTGGSRRGGGLPPPQRRKSLGGEGGIRTPGALSGTAVFKTAPFGRSGTSPHAISFKLRRSHSRYGDISSRSGLPDQGWGPVRPFVGGCRFLLKKSLRISPLSAALIPKWTSGTWLFFALARISKTER